MCDCPYCQLRQILFYLWIVECVDAEQHTLCWHHHKEETVQATMKAWDRVPLSMKGKANNASLR